MNNNKKEQIAKEPITKEEFEKVKKEHKEDMDKEYLAFQKQKREEKFKLKGNIKKVMTKSLKKRNEIMVLYMNLRRELEGPFLTKIYGGNFLVIKNHVYRFNPKNVLKWRKYSVVIVRAWDRNFVGYEDYDEIMKSGDERSTINDPVLIKAVIAARLAERRKEKKGAVLYIIIGIAVFIGAMMLFGGK